MVSSFKMKLLEIYLRPEKRSIFKVSDLSCIKLLTGLHVNLCEHKLRNNFYVTAILCAVKTMKPLNIASYAASFMLTIKRSS